MTLAKADDPAAIEQVRELLPWFAAGTLAAPERQFVDDWLTRHGAQHPALTRELNWLRRTAAQLRELAQAQAPSPQAGLSELMARIGAQPEGGAQAYVKPSEQASAQAYAQPSAQASAQASAKPSAEPSAQPSAQPADATRAAAPVGPGQRAPAPSSLGRRFSLWVSELLAPRPAFAFALVGLLLAQAAVIGGLLSREPARQESLAGSIDPGGSATAHSVLLSVVFSADAREADIRAVLAHAGAQIVAGPSALGLYRVAVQKAGADAALAALQAAKPTVESVQREP